MNQVFVVGTLIGLRQANDVRMWYSRAPFHIVALNFRNTVKMLYNSRDNTKKIQFEHSLYLNVQIKHLLFPFPSSFVVLLFRQMVENKALSSDLFVSLAGLKKLIKKKRE